LHVNLDESDEFGTFIFRTPGFNSIRTLAARLSYYHAASNGLLSCLPLQLTLRGKSTIQSYRQPVYYVDLTLRDGLTLNEVIIQAQKLDKQCKEIGYFQEKVDNIARDGFLNSKFHFDYDENLFDEFTPTTSTTIHSSSSFIDNLQETVNIFKT